MAWSAVCMNKPKMRRAIHDGTDTASDFLDKIGGRTTQLTSFTVLCVNKNCCSLFMHYIRRERCIPR